MSVQLMLQNKNVLKTYRVGMNVILHVAPKQKVYGHIERFALNSSGEVILVVAAAQHEQSSGVHTSALEYIHPLNKVTTVEIIG